MQVTQVGRLPEDVVDRYWPIYDEAFRPLRGLHPCRQSLNEEEFREEMENPSVVKFVLGDPAEPVAMTLIAADLTAVPWADPFFFERYFPEHYARRVVFYFMAILVMEAAKGEQYSKILLADLIRFVNDNRGIAAFDTNDLNAGFLPELIMKVADPIVPVELHKLGLQHYFAILEEGTMPADQPADLTSRELVITV